MTSSALDGARARALEEGGTIGEQLVADGTVPDALLTDFYKSRLLVPQVNPNTLARLPASVIALIPGDRAIELRVIPVSLDHENNLTVAMSDPSDRHAVDEIASVTGAHVIRAVATQMQIAWCLAHYYGHVTRLGQRLLAAQPAAPGGGELKLPRPRSISGEIRQPRAQSVRPPMPDDSGPVITIEADDSAGESGPPIAASPALAWTLPEDAATVGGSRPVPKRKRPAEPDPPELAARAGEVLLQSPADHDVGSGPSIVVDDALRDDGVPEEPRAQRDRDRSREVAGEIRVARRDPATSRADIAVSQSEDDSAPVMIHESLRLVRIEDEPSAPTILVRKRPSEPGATVARPVAVGREEDSEVVELAARKTPPGTTAAIQPSIAGTTTPAKREHRRTDAGLGPMGGWGVPAQLEDAETGEHALASPIDRAVDGDPTRVDTLVSPGEDDASSDQIAAPPAPVHDQDTSPLAAPPNKLGASPVPPPSGRVELSNVQRAPASDEDDEDEFEPGDVRGGKPTIEMRIAQPLLDPEAWGAPGTTNPPPSLGAIPGSVEQRLGVPPIAEVDSAPLMTAPPSPPERRAHTSSEAGIARALEQATIRVLDLIRDLGSAIDRDEVIAVMTAHLAETHRRAGFFAVRNSELSLFSITPNVVPAPTATVRVDRPSTLADIVGTRLPYRGPMHDDASRTFLQAILGICPPEILLVPITVRARVVGVLFGEHRLRHTFDDQLALASRAAGDALERILKARRG